MHAVKESRGGEGERGKGKRRREGTGQREGYSTILKC